MIDVNKPLELADGTPVTYVETEYDGDIIVNCGPVLGNGRVFGPSGRHRYGELPDLRNVVEVTPEAPRVDLSKPVQTREGRKVRILATDRQHGTYPVVALVANADGQESTISYTLGGLFYRGTKNDPNDLVNIPDREELYVSLGHTYSNLAMAREDAGAKWPVARVLVEDGKVQSITVLPTDADNTALKGYGTALAA